MVSILTELTLRCKENSNKLLYVFLDLKGDVKESYTYQEFEHRTNGIASFINDKYSLKLGDRVLLAYPPGIEMICAFFACVKLGLIPVPVSPPAAQGFQSSVRKMNFIAEDCKASAILTDRSYYWSIKVNLSRENTEIFSKKVNYISQLEWIVSDDSGSDGSINFLEAHSDILFLQYTSGSTNNPKGVIVTHENILNNCDIVVDHLPIGVSWLPQYHDMGLIGYYIFFALKGGTTYGFSPIDFIQRPALWLETITKYGGSASSAPNFAYEYCLIPGKIPEETLSRIDLSTLRFLMTAAEPISTTIYKDFLKKFSSYGLKAENFFAAYGLAEFTLAVSNYGRSVNSFDSESLKKNVVKLNESVDKSAVDLMSCGKPLGDTKIKIVDINSNLKEANFDGVGEIWVKGLSKCEGYWNQQDLSKETFEAELEGENWLRTGDVGFMYKDELYVCGRSKDMIIIRGHNYYPQDIEIIIEKDPLVRKGCVAAFSIDKLGREALVVIVGIKNNKKVPDAVEINNKLTKYTGINAESIVFVPARTISKTSSGKIMRYQNKNRYLQNELEIIAQVDLENAELTFSEKNNEEVINEFKGDEKDFRTLFKRYKLSGLENMSIGDAGFDSLKLAEFAHDLKAFLNLQGFDDLSNEIDLRLIQKIAVSELFEILQGLQTASPQAKFSFKHAFNKLHKEFEKVEMDMMERDAAITSIETEQADLKPYTTENGHILLTGGTGFFGPFLIKSLLEQNSEKIYVIVRAKGKEEGMNRLRESFSLMTTTPELKVAFEERVVPICGDISRTKLGVNESEWEFLTKNIHSIYHNGAIVNYLLDYESMRKINVGGTNEVIRLAMTERNKILNHISTTFIFGWSVKDTLLESDSNDKMELLDFGYSQSKWVSDRIVLNAMKKGLKARIFRPALISPSITGEGYNYDISIRLLSFMVKYGIGTSAQNQVSFTPADLGANNIVAISNIEESCGKSFHVTRDTYSSMQDVTEILGKIIGKKFVNFPLKAFVPEVIGRCKKEDILFPLLNFLVRSVDNISTMEFKRYDNSNYVKYRDLSPWGKEDPSLEEVVGGIHKFMDKNEII